MQDINPATLHIAFRASGRLRLNTICSVAGVIISWRKER